MIDIGLILIAVLVLSLAVTSQSLWIDEAFIAWVLAHGGLHSIATSLAISPLQSPADRQYPLYDIWMFGWTRLFGFSEYALRSANIPFAAIFIVALSSSSRLIFGRRFAWLPFAATPFAWFYMNEARPYMMLLAFSTAAIGALGTAIFGRTEIRVCASWIFFWALLIAFVSNILAILALPGLILLLIIGARIGSLEMRSILRQGLCFAPLFALVLIYYIFTFAGAGARVELLSNTRTAPISTYSLVTIYEQLGLAGIGPPRNIGRLNPTASAILPYVPLLAPALLAYLIAIALSLKPKPYKATVAFLCSWALSFVCAFALSSALGVRFLGRHTSAVLPFMLLGSIGFFRARLSLLLLICIFIVSDLRLLLISDYGKDDYRATTNKVVNCLRRTGGTVDWSADEKAATYYGLALQSPAGLIANSDFPWAARAPGVAVINWAPDAAETLVDRQLRSGPVYIVISKPDIFDVHEAWGRIVHRPAATLLERYTAFEIFELPPEPKPSASPSPLRPSHPSTTRARCEAAN